MELVDVARFNLAEVGEDQKGATMALSGTELPGNYIDNPSLSADLEPVGDLHLLFAAWMSHGPGHMEELEFYAGETKCGTFDVLWMKSDWAESIGALAWLPRGRFVKQELWKRLLTGYWHAEKAANEWERPNFDEVISSKRGELDSEIVWQIAHEVWPDWPRSDPAASPLDG